MRQLLNKLATVFILFLFVTSLSYATDTKLPNSNLDYSQVEETLLQGLNSDNFGLKISSAYMLGEIKSEKAILPLTKMLRDETDERARLVSALSLIKIGTERSVYVVKQGKRFNEFDKVRERCQQLYNAHLVSTFKGKTPNQSELFAYLYRNQ